MRALVLRAGSAPSGGRWQVVVIEDADRLTEAAGNALLKAIEEPPPRTVFLLCTPSIHPDDISVTIRSRCRVVPLRQPSADAVAEVLVRRDGIAPDVAAWAAAAAQGHVGRAKRLARDPEARKRRDAVLAVPRRLTGVGAVLRRRVRADRGGRGRGGRRGHGQRQRRAGGAGDGRSAPAGPAGAPPGRSVAPPVSSRSWRSGRSPGRPGRSGTPWTGRWSTWPGFYRDVLDDGLRAPVAVVHTDTAPLSAAAAAEVDPREHAAPAGGDPGLPGSHRGERQTADRGGIDDAQPVEGLTVHFGAFTE